MNLRKQSPNIINTILLLREKREHPTLTKLGLLTLANGLVASEMAKEFRFGLMVLVMKEIGKTIERMVRANSFMLMETFTRETGSMTRQMVSESIFM